MKRRALSVILTAAMVFCYTPAMAFADTDADSTSAASSAFTDMPDDWSTSALQSAVSNGLMKGYQEKDGLKIKPSNTLTRAEMATIVNNAFGASDQASLSGVDDVDSGAWYAGEIAKAIQMGTMAKDSQMRPNDSVTRQEAFTILGRALKMPGADSSALSAFADQSQVASWAEPMVGALIQRGYVSGNNGNINPSTLITRAEFAKTMDNVIKQYIHTSGTYTAVNPGNVMVNTDDVTLKNVTVTGNLILGDGVGNGNVTLDNVTVTGDTIVRGGGVNSVIITGNSSLGNVIIAKVDGNVRVAVEGSAKVSVIIVNDGKNDVVVEGKADTVRIETASAPVVLQKAEIASVQVTAANADLTVAKDSTVTTLSVAQEAKSTSVQVAGTVTTLKNEAPKTELAVTGTVKTVEVASSATGTTLDIAKDAKVNNLNTSADVTTSGAGKPSSTTGTGSVTTDTGTTTKPSTGGSSGGSSGGGSGGGSGSGSGSGSGTDPAPTTKEVSLTKGKYYRVTSGSSIKYLKSDGTQSDVISDVGAQSADKKITVDKNAEVKEAEKITTGIEVAGYNSGDAFISAQGPTIAYDQATGMWKITQGSAVAALYELILPWRDGDAMLGATAGSKFVYAIPDRDVKKGPFYAYGYANPGGQGNRIAYGKDAPEYTDGPVVHVGMCRANETDPLTVAYTSPATTRTFIFAGTDGSFKSLTVTDQTLLTGSPTISGSTIYGATLTAGTSALSATSSLSYQWMRADTATGVYTNIAGATASTYVLTKGDVEKFIKVQVSSADAAGVVTSEATAAIGKKQLSIATPTVASKTYDGTKTSGAVTKGTLSGKVDGDTVDVTATASEMNSANAGSNTVTVSYALTGADVAYYIKPADNTNVAAGVEKKQAAAFTISQLKGDFTQIEISSENVGTLTTSNFTITFGVGSVNADSVGGYSDGKYVITVPKQAGDGTKVLSVTMTGTLTNHTPHVTAVTTTPISAGEPAPPVIGTAQNIECKDGYLMFDPAESEENIGSYRVWFKKDAGEWFDSDWYFSKGANNQTSQNGKYKIPLDSLACVLGIESTTKFAEVIVASYADGNDGVIAEDADAQTTANIDFTCTVVSAAIDTDLTAKKTSDAIEFHSSDLLQNDEILVVVINEFSKWVIHKTVAEAGMVQIETQGIKDGDTFCLRKVSEITDTELKLTPSSSVITPSVLVSRSRQ